MKDKILTMFFDINRWTKAIEKGVLKDIRKSELIKLTEEPTRIRMAEAMLNGQYIIQNSQYEGNLGVELCASLDEFLSNVEHLYTRYKHSIPSTMSECKNRKYFKALSDKDLEDEDMLFGVGRDIAQVELELYILCQIILGIGWDANKMGKWFWQSNKDRDLVILKNWVTVEK